MTKKRISCFISYSDDSKTHTRKVKTLVNRLRTEGFDVKFYEFSDITEDISSFMEESVVNSDKIIMICTPEYVKKANANIGYEKMIITDHLLRLCDITTRKIIPILFSDKAEESLPNFMLNKQPIKFAENDSAYKLIIDAINKIRNNAWTLGELLAPHKAKRKKNIRLSLQPNGKISREETERMIHVFYDRHQYYHTHYWKLVFRVFSLIVTLMTVPFIMTKYFYAEPILLSIPPIISVFVTVFLIMGLKSEEAQLHNIELKTNCLMEVLSENYSNFDPSAFSNPKLFWNKLNRYKVANLVLFLLVGLSLVAIAEGVLIASKKIVINPKESVENPKKNAKNPNDNTQQPTDSIHLNDIQ